MMKHRCLPAVFAAAGFLIPAVGNAADENLTVSRTAVAVQTIIVPEGSPLGLLLPEESEIVASGPLKFHFGDQPPREFSVEAEFFGDSPFPFLLGPTGMTGEMAFEDDHFRLTATGPFELVTMLPIGEGGSLVMIRVFTLGEATFVGDVPGVGFVPGTTFTSPEPVLLGLEIDGVPLVDGNGNPIPVAFSSQRTVTVTGP